MNIPEELRSISSLLSVRQTATVMGTCVATIRRYANAGKLAYVRVGNRLRFDPTVVAAFLECRSSE